MVDKDVAAATSGNVAREEKIVNQGILVSVHMEICDVTERVVEMSRHRDDAAVATAKAQYACPARQETLRTAINSTWFVGAGICGVVVVLKYYLKVDDGLVYAALAALSGLEGIRRWKK